MSDGNHKLLELSPSEIAGPWFGRRLVFAGAAARRAGGCPDAATHLQEWITSHPTFETCVYEDYWVPVTPHPKFSDSEHRIGDEMRTNILSLLRSGRPLLLGSGFSERTVNEPQNKAEELLAEAHPRYIRLQRVYCRRKMVV
ncbi:hypothetical protein B0H14DRAFT_2556188 [Mycena olivaceomarginata]|nr:hypothetical protein B0H14DRAFT_2556188 [Mycena olivaceomarginata]